MDFSYIKDLIWLISLIVAIVGLYWKLRTSRPTYDKVDKMIADKAYSKEKGIRLEEQVKALKDSLQEIKLVIEEISKDVKKLLIQRGGSE